MGWLIALGILVILAVLPLGVSLRYDEDGVVVRVLAGLLGIQLYPGKPKKKKAAKETKKEPQKPGSEETPLPRPPQPPRPSEAHPKKGGSLTDFLPLIKIGLDFLGDFRRKLRVNRLEVKLTLAGDDPCDLAENYGRIWAAVGNLQPRLEKFLVIKKRDIDVQCDFTAGESLVTARLDVTITLGRLISLAVVYGIRALKAFLKLQNKRKGGATK